MTGLALAVRGRADRLADRGIDGVRAVVEGLPPWAVGAFAVVTYLGDAAVLLALAVLAYLVADRRAGAFVAGALFIGFALTIGVKAWIAAPRPPAELRYATAAGFGFPSGHAIGATVGWGGLAAVLDDLWSRRARSIVAGVVIVAVSLSRVAIGVHYLVDVVAGVGIGLGVLAVAIAWLREEPVGLFALAGVLAVGAVAVTGGGIEAAALLGACVGAATAWQVVEPADRPWGRRGIGAGVAALVLLGGVLALGGTRGPLALGTGALAAAVVTVVPRARERWLGGSTRGEVG